MRTCHLPWRAGVKYDSVCERDFLFQYRILLESMACAWEWHVKCNETCRFRSL